MVHGNTDITILLACPTMNRADLLITKELCHRITAKCHNNTRSNGCYLLIKIVIARSNLLRQWITVIRWPTFYHVSDKYIRTFKIDARQEFIQELACRANKWASLSVFVEARSLSNKQDLGSR